MKHLRCLFAISAAIAGTLLTGAVPAAAQADLTDARVELRGRSGSFPGQVRAIGLEGVTVVGQSPGDRSSEVISWDRVRRVTGVEPGVMAPYSDIAVMAWRARSRLERGDAIGAEPLFEELFPLYRGAEGPTASLVCEGLLRCRLRRSATSSAVPIWLAWLESTPWRPSRGLEVTMEELGPVVDRGTGLAPALPPVFLGRAVGSSEIRTAESMDRRDPTRAQLLAILYQTAARVSDGTMSDEEAWEELNFPAMRLETDPAVELCREIVFARVGDPDHRAESRTELRIRAGRATSGREDAWVEAWCRLGVGASLIREDDPEQKRLGVIELLHVSVRLGDEAPLLGGFALGLASETCFETGADDAGQAFLTDLIDRYPGHPALDREPLHERIRMQQQNLRTSTQEPA